MDKETDKMITFFGLLIVTMVVLTLFFVFRGITRTADKKMQENELFKEKIGQNVVINKDTLIIINAYPSSHTYLLSNGISISEKLIKNE